MITRGERVMASLGIPKETVEATIYLHAMKPATMTLTCYVKDKAGKYVISDGVLETIEREYTLKPKLPVLTKRAPDGTWAA